MTIFRPGTRTFILNSTAPPGWTKDTTHDDCALRLTTSATSFGGSQSFSTIFQSSKLSLSASPDFPSYTITSTAGNATITVPQMASHSHTVNGFAGPYQQGPGPATRTSGARSTVFTGNTGSGQAHTHIVSAPINAFIGGISFDNFNVKYIDTLIIIKD